MANTPDPRNFYRVSRLIMMPSLWNESFRRVAAEAQINGIPVVGSDRGSLPEVIGDGGVVLPIPRQYTPESRIVPDTSEVALWVDAIEWLWNNERGYEALSERAKRRSRAWDAARIGERHDAFFRALLRAQAGD